MKQIKKILAIFLSIAMVMCSTLPSLASNNDAVQVETTSKIVEQLKEDLGEEKANQILESSSILLDENNETTSKNESESFVESSNESETFDDVEESKKDDLIEEPEEDTEEKIADDNNEGEIIEEISENVESIELGISESEDNFEENNTTKNDVESDDENNNVKSIEESTVESSNTSEVETSIESNSVDSSDENAANTETSKNNNSSNEENIATSSEIENEELENEIGLQTKVSTISDMQLFGTSTTHYLGNGWYDETAAGVLKKNVTKIKLQNTGSAPSSYSATFDVDGLNAYIVNGTEVVIYIPSGHTVKLSEYASYTFSFGIFNSTLGIYESSLATIDNLNILDTSEATNMQRLFSGDNKLNSIDLSNFNTNNVIDMIGMFENCERLTSLDISTFNTSNVTYMHSMFRNCKNIQSLNLSNFDTSNVTSFSSIFYNCNNATSIDVSLFNTSNATDFVFMFYGCKNLTSIDVSSFNTSNATNFSFMFYGCEKLNSIDVSSFNTVNATHLASMFSNCKSLVSVDVSGFDTSNVQNFQSLFLNCKNLLSVDVSSFNTTNTTNMYQMFYGCENLTNINVGNFDTSNVTSFYAMFANCYNLQNLTLFSTSTENVSDMAYMFYKCRSLDNLDLSHIDTTNTTNMYQMFYGCSNLEFLDISSFDMTDTTYDDMLYGLGSLNTISISASVASVINSLKLEYDWKKQGSSTIYQYDVINNRTTIPNEAGIYERATGGNRVTVTFDTDGGSYISSQTVDVNSQIIRPNDPTKDNNVFVYWYKDNVNIEFDFASAITESFTLHAKWESVTIITSYWYIKNGNELHFSSTIPTDPAYTAGQTFSNFSSESMIPWLQFSSQITKVVIDNNISPTSTNMLFSGLVSLTQIENISNLNTENVVTMFNMFKDCASLQSIDLSTFNTGKVTTMNQMFWNCRNLISLDLTSFNTSNVVTMTGMFADCHNLTSIDISSFDTRKVYNMTNIFGECEKLISIDLRSFNTSNVTDMKGMFQNCEMLSHIDLSSFNTQRVNDMHHMFYRCNALQTIYVSNEFVTTYVTSDNDMFYDCSSLVGGNGTTYDAFHVNKEYARVDATGTPGYFTYRETPEPGPTPPAPTPALDSISVNRAPDKVNYEVGEKFNPTGLKLKLNYSDGTNKVVTYDNNSKSSFSFNPSLTTALTVSNTYVTITYGGKTCQQNITVTPVKVVASISVISRPNKVSYYTGNKLNPTGLKIKVYYVDGTTEDITYSSGNADRFTFNPTLTTNLTISMNEVVVTYRGKSSTFAITVTKSSGGNVPSGGGGSGGGGGGGGGGGALPANLPSSAPSTTTVAATKAISGTIDSSNVNWAVDPATGKWVLGTTVNGQSTLVSNGFFQINSTATQLVNGVQVQVPTNNTYYFDATGAMVTGWIQTADSKWYFFENAKTADEGKMQIGWKEVQGSWYFFGADGAMYQNQATPDGFFVDSNGKWIQV